MMPSFETLLGLVQQSGNPLIWAWRGDAYVTLSVQQYQKLLAQSSTGSPPLDSLSEDDLVSKINHDIATWRANQSESDLDSASSTAYVEEILADENEVELQEDQYYLEPVE